MLRLERFALWRLFPLRSLIQLRFRRRWRIRKRHAHRDREFARDLAFENSPSRRHVRIIAPDRRANVSIARHQVVGWIEPHPAQSRQQSFDPRVARALRRSVRLLRARVEIPTYVAAWNLHMPHQRRHDVREILTYTLARGDRMVDRRIHARRLG